MGVFLTYPEFDSVLNKLVQVVQMRIRLGHVEVFFLVRRQIDDLVITVGDEGLNGNDRTLGELFQCVYLVGPDSTALAHDGFTVLTQDGLSHCPAFKIIRVMRQVFKDLPIRRLDEAVWVDPGEGRQGTEQPDVGTFRGLDGADTAIVGEVNIPHVESGPFPG